MKANVIEISGGVLTIDGRQANWYDSVLGIARIRRIRTARAEPYVFNTVTGCAEAY